MFQPTNDMQRAALRAYQNAIQTIAFTPGARLNAAAPEKAAAIRAGMTLQECDLERWHEAEKIASLAPINLDAIWQ